VTVLPAPSATTSTEGTAPSITSSPVATPNPAVVSQSVLFAVAASNLNDNALIYAWDFGDGSTGSGAQVTHVYSATGTYNATVTVSDGASSVTAQVIVAITSSDAANSNTPVSLETLTLGHPFKLQLPWPMNMAPTKKVRTTAQGLPRGVRVSGNWIVGRPRQAGTFTISVRFSIKTVGIVTQATEQYTFTVSP
jgi:PKD repeat protein